MPAVMRSHAMSASSWYINCAGSYPKMFELAQCLEGKVRHASVHAAGVIITPEKLTNYSPFGSMAPLRLGQRQFRDERQCGGKVGRFNPGAGCAINPVF
jgi:DNA polymerase III alpha subunit